jgi:hypothetical protein
MNPSADNANTEPSGLRARLKELASPLAAEVVRLFLLGLVRALTGSQARWWGCPPKAEQRIYFANHLDRVDSLCFAAPVFFHSVRWYFGL